MMGCTFMNKPDLTSMIVNEKEIAQALNIIYEHTKMKVEPAAALTIAGILSSKDKVKGKTVIAIICGGNIADERFEKIVTSCID